MRNLQTLLFCSALVISPAVALGQTPEKEATSLERERGKPPTEPAPGTSATMPVGQAAAYAAREAAAPELQKFKGGASLSVTLGTTALIVLAILVALIIIF